MNKTEVSGEVRIPDSWTMNNILGRVEDDADKVKLVDLWTEANRMKKELRTLNKLIEALKGDLPY